MFQAVLKGINDISFDSELFPEVMRPVGLRSVLNRFSSIFPGGVEVSNGDYRLCSPILN